MLFFLHSPSPPFPPPLRVPPGRDLGRGKRYHWKAFWKEVSKVYLERDDWKEYWKVSPEHAEVPSKEGRRIDKWKIIFIYLFISFFLSFFLSLFIYLFIYLVNHSFVCVSIYLFIYVFIHLFIILVYLFICWFTY